MLDQTTASVETEAPPKASEEERSTSHALPGDWDGAESLGRGPSRRSLLVLGGGLALAVVVASVAVALSVGGGSASSSMTLAASRSMAAAALQGPHVVPFPGTPDASPSSQVVFSSLSPGEIRSVSVTGSRSGGHSGRLILLPDGRGTAFVPTRPFTSGETVDVSVVLRSPAAGTAEGAPNATNLRYSFTVQSPVTVPVSSSASSSRPISTKPQPLPTERFHSAPGLTPPAVTTTGADPDTVAGDIFLTPNNGKQAGPEILDSQGQLVWFDPITSATALNLQIQTYEGKRVLTWWQGDVVNGHGADGTDMVLDSSYQTVAALHAGEGYSSDLHEFTITPQNTALVTAYVPVKTSLSSVGGPEDGSVYDCVIQELDIDTGQVLWEWHALGHVPLSASHAGKPTAATPYDYFHINSIQELSNGNLLISARNTWAVYEISRATGKVIWTLGGKDSGFTMNNGTRFEWQHDAQLNPNRTLTLFDDGDAPREESQSSAKQLRLDFQTMTASLLHDYTHAPQTLANSQGSMQTLPDGNVFVGWGEQPYFSEYTVSGQQIFSGSFTFPVSSYRAYRFTWKAQPTTRPAIATTTASNRALIAYASWNGATDVARWQLLAGSTPDHLAPVRTVADSGFETSITGSTHQPYLAVRALSATGRVLGTSRTITR